MSTLLSAAVEDRHLSNSEVEVGLVSSDGLEGLLVACERSISRLRRLQARVIAEVDRRGIPRAEGARTLNDWITARTDVAPETAAGLRSLSEHSECADLLEEGVSFDRAVQVARTGQSDPLLHLDISGVRRVAARHRRVTRQQEHDTHAGRYLVIQPDLEHTAWRIHGQIPALQGAVIARALDEGADQIRLETGAHESRTALRVDALAAICADRTSGIDDGSGSVSATVTVLVDAKEAAPTNGESGCWIASGPRVGPATLERLVCEARIEVTAVTEHGTPLAVGTATTAIPGRTRRYVLARDGGCVVDGCTSRYRLQPHHVRPRHRGGTNHPDNLATLCWYHHHTVIHGQGFSPDPDTPPTRRRLLRPAATGPP